MKNKTKKLEKLKKTITNKIINYKKQKTLQNYRIKSNMKQIKEEL